MACTTTDVQLVTPMELTKLLHLSLRKVREMGATGELPNPIRIGRSVRYRLTDIQEWLEGKAAESRR